MRSANRLLRLSKSLGFVLAFLLIAKHAFALPIGFGLNQGELQYAEIRNDHFYVYHDRRVSSEGRMVLNALEAVRPIMERWFEEKRSRPLPVIMSAVTDSASFANIVSDAIELQTLGQADKSLTWHEYTHTTMYSRFRNFFGPAGDLLHVVWMPAWYLEGLAEALSVSVGSDVTAGIERWQALTETWPSYDRLHSLYAKYGFFETGYATSGAFVSYILRKSDPNQLASFLKKFHDYTMPWWWPWSVVPFNDFLPLDAALKELLSKTGEQLYADYQRDARQFWQNALHAPFLYADPGEKRPFTSIGSVRSNGHEILQMAYDAHGPQEMSVEFDSQTGWATSLKTGKKLPSTMASQTRSVNAERVAWVDYDPKGNNPRAPINELVVKEITPKRSTHRLRRSGQILEVFEAAQHIIWLEIEQAQSRLCYFAKADLGRARQANHKKPRIKPICPITARQPTRLRVLGETTADAQSGYHGHVKTIWLDREIEKLTGSQHEIIAFDANSLRVNPSFLTTEARPIALTTVDEDIWLLLGERNQRSLRRYDPKGRCQGMLRFQDHVLNVWSTSERSLVLGLYGGEERFLRKIKPEQQKTEACSPIDSPISPLLHAVRHADTGMDLKTAFAGADLWQTNPQVLSASTTKKLQEAPPLDEDTQGDAKKIHAAEEAQWRGRPVLLFPWIGAEDALGTQFGAVSVPLMDHLQNETVRATFLYGPASRYPYSELSLTSTRWTSTVNLAIYRSQTYNGRYYTCLERDTSDECVAYATQSRFFDEKGARLETETPFSAWGGDGSFGLGMKYAYLDPYIGPQRVRHGWLSEPSANLSLSHQFGKLNWTNSLSGRIAPSVLNRNFDYNQLGFASSLGRTIPPLWSTRLSLGIEASRTRGKRRRELQEVYRPLKTFVPGSGGGYNQNSFPIAGEASGGLFAPVFADTQGRVKLNATTPIIADLDKLIWILYLERLDFSMFYNYGAAWNGPEPRRGWQRLIRAHGYALDLQLENKGVRFNLGMGAGQVIGRDFEVYLTSGFDALF